MTSTSNPTTPHFVFFGTPYVARDTLSALAEAGYVPSLVVTSPDAPRGRGKQVQPCETKEWALAHGIPVVTPQKLTREFRESLAAYEAEFALVVAYGKILSETLIKSFPRGVLNIHYSLLPKYRGASPVEAALLNNDSETGVAIQRMVRALDAGDVLAQEVVAIEPTETTRELRPRLVAAGAALLVRMLPEFIAGSLSGTPQDESHATFTGKIDKSEGELTLGRNDQENWDKYRAYAESPGTYFFMQHGESRKRIKIVTARFENGAFAPVRVIPEGKSETEFENLSRAGWVPEA